MVRLEIMRHQHLEIFTTYLGNLGRLLEKLEAHESATPGLLSARLAEDMFPLITQAEIAMGFSLRASCPIAQQPVVSFISPEKSYAGLNTQLEKTLKHLHLLDALDNDLTLLLRDKAGPADIALPAEEFLARFALPNFYFHLSMVYAIARARGVPLTKGDFDGLHQYPPGFSFAS